mgnify:CR=1
MLKSITWRLSFARRLFHKSLRLLDAGDPFSTSEAVMAAQDGLETFLVAVCNHLELNPSPKGAGSVVQKPAKQIPSGKQHVHRFEALNKLRVNIKHYGTAPQEHAARVLVAECYGHCKSIASADLGINLDELSLSDGIPNQLVAGALAEAEKLIDDADARGFLKCVGFAFRYAHKRLSTGFSGRRIARVDRGKSFEEGEFA